MSSGRPYIRGSLADDVLVRYDGITLLDPFHLKNFQSLISAIDPAAVERIEVFSGGFPVRYGTRSGGVIDISAPSRSAGLRKPRGGQPDFRRRLDRSAGARTLPLDWLFAVRRSTLDLLDPVEDDFGQPQFSDSLGRLRWNTRQRRVDRWAGCCSTTASSWAATTTRKPPRRAIATNTSGWRAITNSVPQLRTRATLVFTNSERHATAVLDEPGVADGHARCRRTEFDRIELNNLWTWEPQRALHLHLRRRAGRVATRSTNTRAWPATTRRSPRPSVAPLTNDLDIRGRSAGVHLRPARRERAGAGLRSKPSSACGSTASTTTSAAITRRSVRA